MLRLVNKDRIHEVTILDDVVLHLVSLSIREKEELLMKLSRLSEADTKNAIESLFTIISPAIVKITGPDIPDNISVIDLLQELENMEDLQAIVTAITEHCSLTIDEAKNLDYSLDQSTADSTGNVVKAVEQEE